MPPIKKNNFFSGALNHIDQTPVNPDYYSQGNNLTGLESKNLADEMPLYTTQLDVEEQKANNQGWLDKFANGTLQAANTAVVGTVGNTAGVVHGLFDLATGGSFFDNATFQFMDEWDEAVKDTIPLYRSQQEQTGSLGDRVLDKDFLFGDVFQGLGFVASSLIPGAGWTKAGKVARTAILAGKVKKLGDLTAKGIITLDEAAKLAKFIKATDNALSTATNLGAVTMGRMYESRLEAKDVYDSTYNKSYDRKLQELTQAGFSEEEAITGADEFAQQQAIGARNYTFGANMLLAIPDMYQYAKLFGGLGNKVNTVKNIASKTATQGILGKAGNVLTSDAVKVAVTEAIEEGTQYNIAETSKKLAEKNYSPDVQSFVSEFINQSIQNISSPEFLQASLAGAVVGGGLNLIGNSKNTDEPNAKIAIQDTNENADLLRAGETAKDDLTKFTELEKNKTDLAETISNKDTPEETKIKAEVQQRQVSNLQFAQRVKSNIEQNNVENFLLDIETLGSNSKEQASNDFGTTVGEYKDNGEQLTPKEQADKAIKRAKKQVSIYQDIQTKYTNLSQISKDELYNNLITTDYNNEKLELVSSKILNLNAEKDNSELTDIPFSASKKVDLDNLIKEKEILKNSQADLDKRFLEIKEGKAEGRTLKVPKTPVVKETKTVVEKPVLETVTSNPDAKFKGAVIDVLERKEYPSGTKISFKVKGSNNVITLSEAEYNKQVLGSTLIEPTVQSLTKETIVDNEDYSIDDVIQDLNAGDKVLLSPDNKFKPVVIPSNRRALGTATFFNSPLFFRGNESSDNRNVILSQPDWKSRFRVVLNKKWASDKAQSVKIITTGQVDTYTNGGPNALDITVEYNNITSVGSDNWVNFGSLPYSGMLRDSKGNPYDFSSMSYPDFIKKFYITDIQDSNGVEQTVEFTEDQYDLLKIQQNIFKEFETLSKQLYNSSPESEIVLPDTTVTSRLVYFTTAGETALKDISSLEGFNNVKLLAISDGKVNKNLTNTENRIAIPDYLVDTYGTSNKTFINLELENGINFWTPAFIKGNNKKVESEVSDRLIELAINYNTSEVSPETELSTNDIIRDINDKVFILNNLENYLNFRVYPLESKKGFKIKVQYKSDQNVKYVDIFNPETTVKADGTRLSAEELKAYFTFDNLSLLINDGFNKQGIPVNINANSFIANNTKGNPKLEDLTLPITGVDLNIKFDYNIKELPTLVNAETLDKSINPSIDDSVVKEVEELKAKSVSKKRTNFSKVINQVLPLKGNEETYKKYNLLNKEGQIKSVNPNSEAVKEWVRTNNNSPYYTFVIRQTPSGYKIFISDKSLYSKLEDNTNTVGISYLTNIASKIKNQYGLNVIIDSVFDDTGKPVKGKFDYDTVYLNPQYATQDTPLHEVIHPFIALVQDKNPLLYSTLIKELKNSDIGNRIISQVTANYGNSTQEEVLEESLVTVMGYYASGVIANEEKGLINIIKAFFKKLATYINNIFGKNIDPSELATTTTIADLSDIIATRNINLGEVFINNPKESKLDLLGANDSNKLINTIGAKTVERITSKPTKDNLNSIIDSIIEQTKLENNTKNVNADSIEDLQERNSCL